MPDDLSLHPFDERLVRDFVAMVMGDGSALVGLSDPAWSLRIQTISRDGLSRALTGDETGANAVTFGFAQAVATLHPTFVLPGTTFTPWERRIDRGLGMLLRPPARLFGDAGLPTAAARTMPIRLDIGMSRMGGAYIPARLVPELAQLLDQKRDRLLRRLAAAELDAVTLLGQLITATTYAVDHRLAMLEASGVVTPGAPEGDPPGARVFLPDRCSLEPVLRRQLEDAARPPKSPGLATRLLHRRQLRRTGPAPEQ
jgi:hypothetical protein